MQIYFQATSNQSYVSNVCFRCDFPLGCLAIYPMASKWPLQNDVSLRAGRLPTVLASRWEIVLPERSIAYSGSSQSGSLGVWMNIFDQMHFTKADCHSHNVHYWQGDSEAQHNTDSFNDTWDLFIAPVKARATYQSLCHPSAQRTWEPWAWVRWCWLVVHKYT